MAGGPAPTKRARLRRKLQPGLLLRCAPTGRVSKLVSRFPRCQHVTTTRGAVVTPSSGRCAEPKVAPAGRLAGSPHGGSTSWRIARYCARAVRSRPSLCSARCSCSRMNGLIFPHEKLSQRRAISSMPVFALNDPQPEKAADTPRGCASQQRTPLESPSFPSWEVEERG